MSFKEPHFNSLYTLWPYFCFCIHMFFQNGYEYSSMPPLLAGGRVANEELMAQGREQVAGNRGIRSSCLLS